MEAIGVVKYIDHQQNNGHEKKVIDFHLDTNECIFVEFQSKGVRLLNHIEEEDRVKIRFIFNGKKSKIGAKYNNIIGKAIHKL